ncbi:hypothetical protein PVAND_006060 [Polypedilum vanderplanki]|uniref:N-acetylglucosamine-6-phosphate deacetylase n=1 Tax=Polypedilum vanderplanki TaxID=319348 RepID=A0A9J6C317_POLVA|nr:hypothetical protein PVAND_006060 [Polypedilum vanderplanki]
MLSQSVKLIEPSQRLIKFKNCRILRDHRIFREDLWVRNGKIINPERVFFDEKRQAHLQIDCHNAIISPGFIDLQINGGYGVDFSFDVNTVESGVAKVSKGLLAHGVTSFCPTLVTSPIETYHQVLPKIKRKAGGKHGATILGVHVEGPFISIEKKGAHPENCIRTFENGFETFENVYGDIENISIVTLAPEKPRVPEVITELARRGIVVSVGHSMADLMHGETAVKHGATLITHLFNAMMPFHHRDPGLVGLLASNEIPEGKTVYFGIITDGIHTHNAALRIAYRTHPSGLIIVTDAISAMGLEEGTHRIGQYTIEVRDHKAFIAGTNTLCGSIAPMDECVRIFKAATNCPLEFALEAASLHPAKCLEISDRKGTLNYGADADFILMDDNLVIHSTWIAGECVFESESHALPPVVSQWFEDDD